MGPRWREAHDAVALRERRAGGERGGTPRGRVAAAADPGDAARAERARAHAARRAGGGTRCTTFGAAAPGGRAGSGARAGSAAPRRRVPLLAAGCGLCRCAALAARRVLAGGGRRARCLRGVLHRAGDHRGGAPGAHLRLAPGARGKRGGAPAARDALALRHAHRCLHPAPDPRARRGASRMAEAALAGASAGVARAARGGRRGGCARPRAGAHARAHAARGRVASAALTSPAGTGSRAPSPRYPARRSPSTRSRPCRRWDRASCRDPGRARPWP